MLSYISLVPLSLLLPQLAVAHMGKVTYWDWEQLHKPGSCGQVHTNDAQVVSLSKLIMKNPPNPNNNPLCGTKIYIWNGNTRKITLKVADTCANCTLDDIVVSKGVFQTMADPKQGVVKNVTWYRSGEPVQLPPVGTSGSGSPEYGDSDTLSASSFGGGTGATGAGISSAGSIPSATSVIF